MLTKKIFSLSVFVLFSVQLVLGSGKVEETNIPPPETQYALPENLVGDFIIINSWADREIKIFPNNKFISWQSGIDHSLLEFYGYVVKKGSSWYFMPVSNALNSKRPHPFFSDLTEITLLNNGFSFHEKTGEEVNIAIPKVVISEETQRQENISVNRRKVNQQYYLFDHSGMKQIIDFADITNIENFPPLYHSLEITNGQVNLARLFDRSNGTIGSFGPSWFGFLENCVTSLDGILGMIRFTNSVPYYYISDGTAMIEIKSDNIILTMRCSPEVEEKVKKKFADAQSPVFLILEF